MKSKLFVLFMLSIIILPSSPRAKEGAGSISGYVKDASNGETPAQCKRSNRQHDLGDHKPTGRVTSSSAGSQRAHIGSH